MQSNSAQARRFLTERELKSQTEQWISMLWHAMAATGNGYRRHSLRHTGRGNDRRKDKLEFNGPALMRRYRDRYQSV
jgi:hypothetical protein